MDDKYTSRNGGFPLISTWFSCLDNPDGAADTHVKEKGFTRVFGFET